MRNHPRGAGLSGRFLTPHGLIATRVGRDRIRGAAGSGERAFRLLHLNGFVIVLPVGVHGSDPVLFSGAFRQRGPRLPPGFTDPGACSVARRPPSRGSLP